MGEEHEKETGLMSSEQGGMEESLINCSTLEVARKETEGRGCLCLISAFFMMWEMYLLENKKGE